MKNPSFGFLRVLLFTLLLTSAGGAARAANLVHEFFLPMPEAQIRQSFFALETNVNNTVNSTFSIVVTGDGTVVHYDHWEDGYEVDLRNPVQSTTRVWGDGNNANGIAPGFVNDPMGLPAGTVLTLNNNVGLPRNPSTILYDGRDRVAATKALVISRMAYPTSPGSVLADAVEVPATIDYGTHFVSPVGQDIGSSLFQYTAMFVMAAQDNTSVTIDRDGSGPITPVNVVLNRGESYLVNGGIMKGASVVSTKPVQAQLVRGRIGARYETDWFGLVPRNQWSSTYLTPVGTAPNGNPTYVFVYNPHSTNINVSVTNRTGTASFAVANNGVHRYLMPANSGASFTAAGNAPFFALSVVAAQSSSQVYDWGFTLLPSDVLTSVAVVGLGLGSSDGTQNGNPVWVTTPKATRIYVDMNGRGDGPLSDPFGRKYDVHYDLVAFESRKIFDSSDRNQTAMRIFTADGTPISAAWGQDPSVSGTGNPYLDAGTTVLPFPVPVIRKSSRIVVDNAPVGLSVGDVLEYTVELDNKGLLPLGNMVVIDAPPANITYVPNTTTNIINGATNTVADNVSGTAFPLDGPEGYIIPIILRAGTSKFTYHATIVAPGEINNVVTAAGYNVSAHNNVDAPAGSVTPPTVAFTDSVGNTFTSYIPGAGIYVTVSDVTANTSSTTVQTFTINVRNVTTDDVETITLTETGVNTGVFRNTSPLPSSLSGGLLQQDGALNVVSGNTLSVLHINLYGTSASANAVISAPVFNKVLYLATNGVGSGQVLQRIDPAAAPFRNNNGKTAVLSSTAAGISVGAINSASSANTTTLEFPLTIGAGSGRYLLISVGKLDTATASVSYSNAASGVFTSIATPVASADFSTGPSPRRTAAIYALMNPTVGTGRVRVTLSASGALAVGAVSFTGVEQSAISIFNSASQNGASAVTLTGTTVGDLIYSAVSVAGTQDANPNQGTRHWTHSDSFRSAGATADAQDGSTSIAWTHQSTHSAIAAVALKPMPGGANGTTTFTQTPTFSQNFVLPAGATIRVTNHITTVSGVMPASPNIHARLSYGSTTFLTITNPTHNSGVLSFASNLTSTVTIPAGQAISLMISNIQTAATYTIDYDSVATPSKIILPTTNIIKITSFGVYDAPYPGGNLVSAPVSGSTLYVRAHVTDPFGAYDITSLGLLIDGPGTAGDISTTLTDGSVVASDAGSKTYQYVWQTGTTIGNYNISATANEGTEGITDSAAALVTLNFLDSGTPSTAELTSGNDGAVTGTYAANSSICIRIKDLDKNTDAASAQTITAIVSTGGDSETVTLTETGVNTGIFTGCVPSSTISGAGSNNGTLFAPAGSIITLTYTDPDDLSDVSTATASIPNPAPSIAVSQTRLTAASTTVGSTVEFRIVVVNNGNSGLPTVALTETFPASLTYVSATATPNTVGAGSLAWSNVGPLAVGQSTNITVTFTAAATASPAQVTATADAGGGVTGNSNASVTIVNGAALNITKTITSGPGPVNIGDNITFQIVVQNTGGLIIPTIPLEDTFSASCFEFVSASVTPDGIGAGSLFWNNVGAIGVGGQATINVTMRVVGGCDPALNTVRADYAEDINGQPVPAASGSVGRTTVAGSITGFVYDDKDQSGTFTAGDVGLSDVTITLYSDPDADGDPADGAVVRIVTSGANGSYELVNLTNGNYVVVQTVPAGYAAVAPATGRLSVNVSSLTAFTGRNFFNYVPSPASYGTVSGFVYYDTNLNGSHDVGEVGIQNVTIDLIQDVNGNGLADVGEQSVASTTTGSNGSYTFFNVVPGNYVVRKTDLFGYTGSGDTQAPNDNQIGLVIGSGTVTNGNNFFSYYVPTRVAFVQQPSDAAAGATISPAVTVQLRDENGNAVTNSGVSITLTLTTGTGALAGTVTATTDANGVATFNNLSINLIGAKNLTASSAGLTPAASSAFDITAGAATQLAFVQQPTDAVAEATITPAVTVQLRDAYNNPVTTSGVDIQLALIAGDGTLTGTLTVSTVNGIATFNDLSIDVVGNNKQLQATSAGLTQADSAVFAIVAGLPTQLAFVQQPTDTVAGAIIAPAVTVQLRDAADNPVTASGVEITLNLQAGAGPLNGTLTATTVNGIATFSDLSINIIGNDKELRATSSGLLHADSDVFEITAGVATAVVLTGPADVTAGETSGNFTLTVVDQYGNPTVVSQDTTFTLTSSSGGTVTFNPVSPLTIPNGQGSVTFTYIDTEAGTPVITATRTIGDNVGGDTHSIVVNAGPAESLAFVQQPTDTVAGATIASAVTVQLRDAFNNPVTTSGVTILLSLNSGSGPLNGTLSAATVNGIATFGDLSLDLIGNDKQLRALSLGLTDADSAVFEITAGSAVAVVLNGPANVSAGEESGDLTLTVVDQFGNPTVVSQDTTFVLGSTSGGTVTFNPTSPLTIPAGQGAITFTYTDTQAGNPVITATRISGDNVGSDVHNINVSAGAAASLAFVQQPSDSVAGATISPAVTVQLLDAYNNLVTTSGVDIILSLQTGSGSLSGTLTAATVNGVATFGDLSINLVGSDKQFRAVSLGLTNADSAVFEITAGAAAAAVLTGPANVPAGAESGNFTLSVVDQFGNPTVVSQDTVFVLSSTSLGTVTFDPSSPITILNGQNSVTFTYTDSAPGSPVITASRTSGDNVGFDAHIIAVLPNNFAASYEFVLQPVLEVAGDRFVDQPSIQTLDGLGNFTANISSLLPNDSLVTLTLLGGPGTLGGTLTLDLNSATPGVIAWSDLLVNMAGTNWQLVASNSVLGSITSSVFTVISPSVTPPGYGTNGLPHATFSDPAGPIGLWLANLRGDKYPWYKPSLGLIWRDLVVANYNSNVITVRICRDNGTFEEPVVYETGLNPFAVRSGFFSDNTFEDVAVANHGTNTISIFKSVRNGTGLLLPRVDIQVGSTPNPGPVSIATASASGSRYADIFVANQHEGTVSVLRNIAGTFVLSTNIPVGLNPLSVYVADMDGDGRQDIVTANEGDGTLTILRGEEGFTFVHWKTVTMFPGGQPGPTHALAVDINGDGLMDVAVANGRSNIVSVLLQDGVQNFPVFTNYNVGMNPRSVLLRDLNRDNKFDLAVANYDGATVDFLIGNGDGTFERGGRLPVGRNPMCIVGSNFNSDRATDIAVSNYGDDTISMFLYSGPLSGDIAVTTLQNQSADVNLIGELLGGQTVGYLLMSQPTNGTLSGTPPNLVYTPNNNFVGSDTFTYRVFDTNFTGPERLQFPVTAGLFSTNVPSPLATVTITVKQVNQMPSFTLANSHITVASSAGVQTIENVATEISAGINEADQTVNFAITVTNKAFFSVGPTITPEGTLVFKPAHNAVGTTYLSIRLQDDGGTANGGSNTSPVQVLAIEVLPNVAPSFQLATSTLVVQPFAPVQNISGFANQITAGVGEDGQTVTFLVTVTNSAFFATQPSISASGTLTFAPAWSASGTTYIAVRLRDNGPTTMGGVNQSSEQMVALTVTGGENNPFTVAKNVTFNGLFSDAVNGVAHQSAGYVTLKVTPKLSYSAKLLVDGNAVAVSGKFNTDGTATVTTKNRQTKFGKPELTLNLVLDIANGVNRVTGTVAEGANWSAQLTTDRMVWVADINEPTQFTNTYAMTLPGFANKTDGPVGTGYGVIIVDQRGRLRLSGGMGDGLVLKQSTFISKDGNWPLYVPGYKISRLNAANKTFVEHRGFVLGWLNFATNTFGNVAPEGDVHWINTGWTNTTYSNGFTNHNIEVLGSRWLAPVRGATAPVVNMNNVIIRFAGGNLGADAFNATFLMNPNTTLAVDRSVTNPNSAKAGLTAKTGLFKGTFVHPAAGDGTVAVKPTRYFGVLLQDYNFGSGFFMGPTESGTVELDSAD